MPSLSERIEAAYDRAPATILTLGSDGYTTFFRCEEQPWAVERKVIGGVAYLSARHYEREFGWRAAYAAMDAAEDDGAGWAYYPQGVRVLVAARDMPGCCQSQERTGLWGFMCESQSQERTGLWGFMCETCGASYAKEPTCAMCGDLGEARARRAMVLCRGCHAAAAERAKGCRAWRALAATGVDIAPWLRLMACRYRHYWLWGAVGAPRKAARFARLALLEIERLRLLVEAAKVEGGCS